MDEIGLNERLYAIGLERNVQTRHDNADALKETVSDLKEKVEFLQRIVAILLSLVFTSAIVLTVYKFVG